MENIELQIKDDKLIITIDLTKKGEESKSGKSIVVASTRGNKRIKEYEKKNIMLGLNCYIPKPKQERQVRIRTYMLGVALDTMERVATKIRRYLISLRKPYEADNKV